MTGPVILLISAIGLGGSLPPARAQESVKPFQFETQRVDDYLAQRAAAIAAALGFSTWPVSPELYAAPVVSRTLLRDPDSVTEELRACTTVTFGDEPWPQCTWSWKRLAESRRPSPDDWLDLQITVTPSGRAGQEFLIVILADRQLPTEAVVALYKAAQRPENLGDVAFVAETPKGHETSVTFLRGNVVFRVRGHGALAAETKPLAARLDERLLVQQPMSLEELRGWSKTPNPRR